MIFPKPLDRAVLDGTKTQARRLLRTTRDGTVRPCAYRVGRDYAIQRHHGADAFARIQILDVRRELLGDITFADVRAEGHRTTADFADHWLRRHDRGWPPTRAGEELDATDGEIMARFERHRHQPVWVITFTLHDAPRLLHRDSSRGYTPRPHDALPDEPEAVGPELLELYAADAQARHRGEPGRREEHVRRQMRAQTERIKRLLAAGHDPADVAAALDAADRHLRLLEQQRDAA